MARSSTTEATDQPVAIDRSALGGQIQRLRPRMKAVAQRMLPSPDVADDVVQNACEKAVRKLGQFDGRALFSTWLHRIVVNEALMWLRSERRRCRHVTASITDRRGVDQPERASGGQDSQLLTADMRQPDPFAELCGKQRHRRLLHEIARLPSGEREVLERCALAEASYEDFERETGVAPAAAKSRAFRARQRLRERLGDLQPA